MIKINTVNKLIAPSILAADFLKLGDEVDAVLKAGADVIHFDVMDNHYVPNLSFGPMVLRALRTRFADIPIDVHLMVKPVDSLVEEFLQLGANYISIHPETCDHPHATLNRILEGGAVPGVVLNPGTPIDTLDYLLDLTGLVLVMSVNPGFGGQSFIPASLRKVAAVRERIESSGREIRLEIDGGIKIENIAAASNAGADMFVAGSAIFSSSDYHSTISALRNELAACA